MGIGGEDDGHGVYVVERFDSRECTGVRSREYIYLEPPSSLVIYIYLSLSHSLCVSLCAYFVSHYRVMSLSLKQERKKERKTRLELRL